MFLPLLLKFWVHRDGALPWSLCTLTPTFTVTPSCILSHSDSVALNLRIHLLPRMTGLWTGHMTLPGFLFHSGLNLPLLLSDELFLVEDVHIHLSRLGLCHPKPTISLSWGDKRQGSENTFAPLSNSNDGPDNYKHSGDSNGHLFISSTNTYRIICHVYSIVLGSKQK